MTGRRKGCGKFRIGTGVGPFWNEFRSGHTQGLKPEGILNALRGAKRLLSTRDLGLESFPASCAADSVLETV